MNSLKQNIYIPIEIAERELDSILLIASKLLKRKNYRVIFGSKMEIYRLIFRKEKKEGVYIYKGCYTESFFKKIYEKTDSILILDQELSPNINNFEGILKIRIVPGSIKFIDKYLVLNKEIASKVKKLIPSIAKKVEVLGWPRFELCNPKYSNGYLPKIQEIKKKHGKFLLFISDFGGLNINDLKYLEKKEQEYISSRNDLTGDSKYFGSMKDNYYEELKKLIALLPILNKDRSLPKLVIRPHPSEGKQKWLSLLKNLNCDITVEYDGDVTPWILAAEGVIHRGSTVAVQTYLLNQKQCYFIGNSKIVRKNISYRLSHHVSNLDEIKKWYKNKNKKITKLSSNDSWLKQHSLNKSPSQLIANKISKLKINSSELVQYSFWTSFIDETKAFIENILFFLGLRKNRGRDFKNNKSISLSYIKNRFNHFCTMDDFSIIELRKSLFKIENKK